MTQESSYWVACSVFPGIGPVRFRALLLAYKSAKAIWQAKEKELKEILPSKLVAEFLSFRNSFDIDDYMSTLSALHVHVLTLQDSSYPTLLKEISDAPFVLYVKGKKNGNWNLARSVGIVGTRQVSQYGKEVTRRITEGLVSCGCTIVSGMAYGVDAVAHETAIAMQGKTIAVLGCGIDVVAPPSNAHIYKKVSEEGYGAVVSEMPLGLKPGKGLFPARNRIISGLSRAIVVTEGAEDSGALITARYAAEQGREVFAVPGPITSRFSRAPNMLIKQGATPVESVDDIVKELGFGDVALGKHPTAKMWKGDTQEEQKIIDMLYNQPFQIDQLVTSSGLSASIVGTTITMLEMKGIVKEIGDKEYSLV